jgi:2-keto-4-pentenoate hydratase/2-oxohepta-3-ene-1,7-dioic acid hydratase in catechol pathway
MRLVTFDDRGAKAGVLVGDHVLDLDAAARAGLSQPTVGSVSSVEQIIASPELADWIKLVLKGADGAALDGRGLLKPLDTLRLFPPVTRPPKIICVARNYAEHAKEAGLEISPIPILFARFASTLVGHNAPVLVPAISRELDWEGEFAIIVGKSTNGKRISKAEAMDYVFGYSVFNDVTVRNYQFRTPQYTVGKNFRASGPLGPSIVTVDEAGDVHNLDIKTYLNGEVVQSANTRDMLYDVPTILENIAEFIDLEPGDVIPMGTPAGVGFKRKPPIFLKHGDVVSVEVEGLGTLTNPVHDEAPNA